MGRLSSISARALALLLVALGGAAWWLGRDRARGDAQDPGAGAADERGWVDGPPGLWGVARDATGAGTSGLGAIGYAQGSAPPREGAPGEGPATTRYDRTRAQPGVNLSNSGDRARAELRDLDDTLLHAWEVPYEAHAALPPREGSHQIPWRRVALLDDGGLLAIHDGRALVRLARDSTVRWASPLRAHHDLAVDGERVHVLTRGERVVAEVNPSAPIVDDRVTTLSLDGEVLAELSLWDAFARSEWRSLLDQLTVRVGDVMHSNTLELLDGRLAARDAAFARGNWLVCMRDLDLIVVVDPRAGRLVWLAQGPWRGPHDPTVTTRGTLLVFDNLGRDGDSRILELDVATRAVRTYWAPEDPADLSTQFCGVAAPLANGDVLVTETCRGRAFELTPEGELVWEHRSRLRAGPDKRFVAALFEVQRLARDAPGVRAALGAE